MKKILPIPILLFSFYLNSFSQDILVLKNGDEIKVKISEVLPDMVKYKKWDNQDGPLYSETKGNIFMIKYQNGTKDVFANQSSNNSNVPISNEELLKSEAVKRLETLIINDLKSGQKAQVISFQNFKKTNGASQNYNGLSVYLIYYDVTFQFISNGWVKGNAFEGYWGNGINVYPSEPNLAASGQQFLYATKMYPRGTVLTLSCEARMNKTDNGYVASSLAVKSERNNGVQAVSNTNTNTNVQNQNNSKSNVSNAVAIRSSIPSLSGVFAMDSSKASISFVFESIEDQIGQGNQLKSKILELIRSYKKIKEIRLSSVDSATISKHYQLNFNLVTFYNDIPRDKTIVYSADLRLEVYLWELDKSGRKIKGNAAPNQLIKTKEFLGGTFTSKQGAFEALLPKIQVPLYETLLGFFPINSFITEITDENNKGVPKEVKIACGRNQGVFRTAKFQIIDPSRKSKEHDLEISEIFDDYSICKVKNNESIIATRFKGKDKIEVATIYKINK